MCKCRVIGWLGVVLLTGVAAAQEPRPLTAEQQEKLKQRDRHLAEAIKFGKAGKLPEMIAEGEKKLAIEREIFSATHPDIINSLENVARLHERVEDYGKATRAREELLTILTKQYGKDDGRVTDARLALAHLEILSRLDREGRQQLRQAEAMNRQVVTLYGQKKHAEALRLAQQVEMIRGRLLGENHPHYATSLHNLASQYYGLGDYARALPLYEQARQLRLKLLGENHPLYAASLSSLASIYQAMGDDPKALPLFKQARQLALKLLGENHPDYASSLNNLAMLYHDMGDYPKALPLLEQASQLYLKLLGENHPLYATSLNNLAMLYHDMGDYPKALPLFEQARQLRLKLLGENHPDYANSLNTLASLYQAMGDYTKALSFSQQALPLTLRFWQDAFDSVGERQRLQLLASVRTALDNHLILTRQTQTPATASYPALLAWKGAVAAQQNADRLLRQQSTLRPLFDQLDSVRSRLARLAYAIPAPTQRDIWLRQLEELRDQKEKLEAELARASTTFRNLRRPQPSLDQLRQALPRDTVLIDFIAYTTHERDQKQIGKKERKDWLIVYIVRPDQEVQRLDLGDLQPIEQQVEAWRQAALHNNSQALDAAAEKLKQRLWQPLTRHLGNPRTVLVSPDGPLSRFPFAALPGQKPGSFLLEDVAIGHVTSGRQLVDLLQPGDDLPAATGLLTLGGVAYGRRPGHNPFTALPGTQMEAGRIRDLFQQRLADQKSVHLSGTDASKSHLSTQINQRCRYLHLATHGFFESPARLAAMLAGVRDSERDFSLEQRSRRDDVLTFLPLLKSGLVLAGANTAQGTDAILTAEEVAALDLRSTELVVLSACETGLGNLTQGDGVLGLQRAFHGGGARTLVASLWSVNDAATSVLMEQFYSNFWNKDKPLSKLEALRQAQLFVLNNPDKVSQRRLELSKDLAKRSLPEEALRGPKPEAVLLPDGGKPQAGPPKRSPPAWWAAFLLSGDWQAERQR